ncbi:hypothetical protein AURDEDRAFT_175779 [Auricularia subglabra TFB-10046 SS5]|uniref:Uncharacterized protein n=1 Tax=Auricularia subglabra (strain TFB-10046 / SS5) TaxID=717982 RepID=J0LE92_AURST|nr:hypothetical protein AURDEDRAFT_175779 [Auricularia subglabra TFB-10046 SS5]
MAVHTDTCCPLCLREYVEDIVANTASVTILRADCPELWDACTGCVTYPPYYVTHAATLGRALHTGWSVRLRVSQLFPLGTHVDVPKIAYWYKQLRTPHLLRLLADRLAFDYAESTAARLAAYATGLDAALALVCAIRDFREFARGYEAVLRAAANVARPTLENVLEEIDIMVAMLDA